MVVVWPMCYIRQCFHMASDPHMLTVNLCACACVMCFVFCVLCACACLHVGCGQNNTREFRSIQRVQDVLVRDVSTLLSSMPTLTLTQTQLVTRVAAIEGAVSSAVALLPPVTAALPVSCAAGVSDCEPSVQADSDGNLRIVAPAGTVELQSGTCGVINPCTLMAALNELRAGAGVAQP